MSGAQAIPAIDFSGIAQQQVEKKRHVRPPPHVYFGPKDPETGEMIAERVYEHEEFPKTLYALENGTVTGIIVHTQEQLDALPLGKYFDSPKVFGLLTAPSFEESRQPVVLRQPDPEALEQRAQRRR